MSHFLHSILASLAQFAAHPLFKQFTGTTEDLSWKTISYSDFAADMNRLAVFWEGKLSATGLQQGSVVGVWITGEKYSDLVLIYAISRAGFIPEVFSSSFLDQGLPVIQDLLTATGGKAIIFDSPFAEAVEGISLPSLPMPAFDAIPASVSLPSPLPDVDVNDMALIFHTSGTTSGKPKPVPETHRWLLCQADIQWPNIWQGDFQGQDVFNNIGSFANVGTATTVNYLSRTGQCIVQTSRSDFGREEFLALVQRCHMNRMVMYVPWLTHLLDVARKDHVVLNALRGMRQICYTGAALNPEDVAYIMETGIPVTTLYSSTEIAPSLVSDMNKPNSLPSMRVVPGLGLKFVKTASVNTFDQPGDLNQPHERVLYDLFVPDTAPNCPHPFIRNRPNGHNTGDLFEEVEPGFYVFRGRNDDWIRTGPDLLFCDTKSIEDNVLLSCADLVKHCTVVGHHKPALVIFVEPQPDVATSTSKEISVFKKQLLERIAPFNARLFAHERIANEDHIVIASAQSLIRGGEKSNIRRKAVEETNKDVLERIYNGL